MFLELFLTVVQQPPSMTRHMHILEKETDSVVSQ